MNQGDFFPAHGRIRPGVMNGFANCALLFLEVCACRGGSLWRLSGEEVSVD